MPYLSKALKLLTIEKYQQWKDSNHTFVIRVFHGLTLQLKQKQMQPTSHTNQEYT